MNRIPQSITLTAMVCLFALAMVTEPTQAQPTSSATTVVARVDGEPIYASEVQTQLKQVLRGRQVNPQALKVLQAQTIEQLIGRRLILKFLAKKNAAANDREIDVEIDRIKKRLAVTEKTLDDHLKATNQDLDTLRRTLRWQISWQRYLDRYLTEENLRKFFDRQRRDFDGSKLKVAHILWKVDTTEPAAVAFATAKANELRQQIAAGEITFADAAKRHSQSPTAENGGELGLIERHDSMPESFAHAAFKLKVDEVSPPVTTPFGVHLIKCVAEQRGQRAWALIRPEVAEASMRYMFNWLTERERPDAKVEYTGSLPYFKPGTRELTQ